MVMYVPTAHLGKHLIFDRQFYSAFDVARRIEAEVPRDTVVLVDTDALLPPVLDRFVANRLSNGGREVNWIFPITFTLPPSRRRQLEEWLVCFLTARADVPLVWGLRFFTPLDDERIRIRVGDLRVDARIVGKIAVFHGAGYYKLVIDRFMRDAGSTLIEVSVGSNGLTCE